MSFEMNVQSFLSSAGGSRVGMWAAISDHPGCNYFYSNDPFAMRHQGIKRGAGELSLIGRNADSRLFQCCCLLNPRPEYKWKCRSCKTKRDVKFRHNSSRISGTERLHRRDFLEQQGLCFRYVSSDTRTVYTIANHDLKRGNHLSKLSGCTIIKDIPQGQQIKWHFWADKSKVGLFFSTEIYLYLRMKPPL